MNRAWTDQEVAELLRQPIRALRDLGDRHGLWMRATRYGRRTIDDEGLRALKILLRTCPSESSNAENTTTSPALSLESPSERVLARLTAKRRKRSSTAGKRKYATAMPSASDMLSDLQKRQKVT